MQGETSIIRAEAETTVENTERGGADAGHNWLCCSLEWAGVRLWPQEATMEVRNSDESLWLCVYTPESRKEGNQPRSAKSGEVRENGCSPPALQ
ncbi:hypothetical protein KUCAC02_001390 [Chaenocephalus aceratus]|uniref:Uncharacterized protein n=1 Tax=Chaenocephalus aceratus TaxID=36190 RepID=A0ACB9XSZ6_CHAAC|nr:hypothetical protein KUCAC02_001390 [Chaenocephalus aceratus]